MIDTPNDWTDNDLEQLSRIAPSAGAPSAVCPRCGGSGRYQPSSQDEETVECLGCGGSGRIQRAPSDHAGKVREIVERWFVTPYPKTDSVQDTADTLIVQLEAHLDAECKAAVASALSEAAKHRLELFSAGYFRCSCGISDSRSVMIWWPEHIRTLSPDPDYVKKQVAAALIPPEAKIRGLESNAKEADEIQAELEAVIDRLLSHSPMLAITGHKKLYTWIYCSCGFNKEYATHTTAPAAWAQHVSGGAAGYIVRREAEAEIAALDLAINCPELVRKQRDKMVEVRDRIAKGTK